MLYRRTLSFLGRRYFGQRYRDVSVKDFSRDLFADETVREAQWPNGARAAVNLQFDDFCAKSKGNYRYDYGGAYRNGINVPFEKLLDEYPELRTTLFAVPNAQFKNVQGVFYGRYDDRYALDRSEHRDLVTWLKSNEGRIEVACHGLTHVQTTVPYFLGALEFEFQTCHEARATLAQALKIFSNVGLGPRGFRPPAWGVGWNAQFGLVEALKDFSFAYVSLSSPLSGLNWREQQVSNVYPQYYGGLLNLPQNVSLAWPIERITEATRKVVEHGGMVTLMGHYVGEDDWMEDGIGPRTLGKVRAVVRFLNGAYPGQVWYATLAEIADHWHAKYPAEAKRA